jgi:hypothetical protein
MPAYKPRLNHLHCLSGVISRALSTPKEFGISRPEYLGVLAEAEFRFDMCRWTRGTHIETKLY